MKATELRIGNWYLWEAEGKKYPYQIEARDLDSNYIQNFDPVPLTEEWLVKLGFRGWEDSYPIDLPDGFLEIEDDFSYGIKSSEKADTLGFWYADAVQYVHELQNLYFALTGEELTPKE